MPTTIATIASNVSTEIINHINGLDTNLSADNLTDMTRDYIKRYIVPTYFSTTFLADHTLEDFVNTFDIRQIYVAIDDKFSDNFNDSNGQQQHPKAEALKGVITLIDTLADLTNIVSSS